MPSACHRTLYAQGIFYNIKNFLTFQLSTAVAALSIVAIATFMGFKCPINAMQVNRCSTMAGLWQPRTMAPAILCCFTRLSRCRRIVMRCSALDVLTGAAGVLARAVVCRARCLQRPRELGRCLQVCRVALPSIPVPTQELMPTLLSYRRLFCVRSL